MKNAITFPLFAAALFATGMVPIPGHDTNVTPSTEITIPATATDAMLPSRNDQAEPIIVALRYLR
jgi:hypothetical protein